MSLSNNFKQGFHNFPSYALSGVPFVKTFGMSAGDSVYVSFPFITNFVHVGTNSGDTDNKIKIGFTPNSIANNRYFTTNRFIRNSANVVDPVFKYRCNELYLKNDTDATIFISVTAGLTNIPSGSFPVNYENIVYGL